MYINIKNKYKKILWLVIGFLIACSFINTVHAGPSSYTFDSAEQERVNIIWNDIGGKTMQSAGFTATYENSTYVVDDTKILNKNDYPYLSVHIYSSSVSSPYRYYHEYTFIDDVENLTWSNQIWSYCQRYRVNNNYKYHSLTITVDTRDNSIVNRRGAWYLNGNYFLDFWAYNSATGGTDFLNFDLYKNGNIFIANSFTYSVLPTYLNGYSKITLTTDDRYYMLSGFTTGSIFIPIEDFNNYGGRLSYYDNDLSSQPFTSYIQDYTLTPDGLYARQDFDLSSYYGADFVMFSKYIYLEGDDDITYGIWVPDDITDSPVTITPNASGGNDFTFQYKDSNGDIQNETTSSVDLTPPQPLLSDVFNNFTTNYYGLSSIILSPISFLESVNNASCSPLSIPSPLGSSSSFTLPCMTPLYQTWFGDLFTLYQTITTGFIAYYVGLGYFNLIKGLKDPCDDRIEVIHL